MRRPRALALFFLIAAFALAHAASPAPAGKDVKPLPPAVKRTEGGTETTSGGKSTRTTKPGTKPTPVPVTGKARPYTQGEVLALARAIIAKHDPLLKGKDRETANAVKGRLAALAGDPEKLSPFVNEIVNASTVAFTGMKSLDALLVISAGLVLAQPTNPRATNLFAAILHTANRFLDAAGVLEYTRTISHENILALLNLANVLLDLKEDERARMLLERVIARDGRNRDAHKAMGYYWHKKGNNALARQAMEKAVKDFPDHVSVNMSKKRQVIEENTGEAGDSVEVLAKKAEELKDCIPISTADIIEDSFPDVAQKIRNRYGRLVDDERLKLPNLPDISMNSNKGYTENQPCIIAWSSVFARRHAIFLAKERFGVLPEDDEAGAKKIEEEVTPELQAYVKQARAALEMMKNMPGVSKAEIARAAAELAKAEQQLKMKKDASAGTGTHSPQWDDGTPIAEMNYADYMRIRATYELYFARYYLEMDTKLEAYITDYLKLVQMLREKHEKQMEQMKKSHACELKQTLGGWLCPTCYPLEVKQKRELNGLAAPKYANWVNYYLPEYAKNMKPKLEEYWGVMGLYIKNMHDPETTKREYLRVKEIYLTYARRAGMGINQGGVFGYVGPTREEEAKLRELVAGSEVEAPRKEAKALQEYDVPKDDWMKWVEDHLVLEVDAEFLSLKITARSIEFEAWAMGPGAGIKFDLVDATMETYVGVGSKFTVGVNVAGQKIGVEAKADFARKWTKWDFVNGTYEEGYNAKAGMSAEAGSFKAGGEVELDPQLNAKATVAAQYGMGQVKKDFDLPNPYGGF